MHTSGIYKTQTKWPGCGHGKAFQGPASDGGTRASRCAGTHRRADGEDLDDLLWGVGQRADDDQAVQQVHRDAVRRSHVRAPYLHACPDAHIINMGAMPGSGRLRSAKQQCSILKGLCQAATTRQQEGQCLRQARPEGEQRHSRLQRTHLQRRHMGLSIPCVSTSNLVLP